MTMLSKKISITDSLSEDLALRIVADKFFDELEHLPEKHITIDFCQVRSITRSFAHEYLCRKQASTKKIEEIRVPSNVEEMLSLVQKGKRTQFPEINDKTAFRLTL